MESCSTARCNAVAPSLVRKSSMAPPSTNAVITLFGFLTVTAIDNGVSSDSKQRKFGSKPFSHSLSIFSTFPEATNSVKRRKPFFICIDFITRSSTLILYTRFFNFNCNRIGINGKKKKTLILKIIYYDHYIHHLHHLYHLIASSSMIYTFGNQSFHSHLSYFNVSV